MLRMGGPGTVMLRGSSVLHMDEDSPCLPNGTEDALTQSQMLQFATVISNKHFLVVDMPCFVAH